MRWWAVALVMLLFVPTVSADCKEEHPDHCFASAFVRDNTGIDLTETEAQASGALHEAAGGEADSGDQLIVSVRLNEKSASDLVGLDLAATGSFTITLQPQGSAVDFPTKSKTVQFQGGEMFVAFPGTITELDDMNLVYTVSWTPDGGQTRTGSSNLFLALAEVIPDENQDGQGEDEKRFPIGGWIGAVGVLVVIALVALMLARSRRL